MISGDGSYALSSEWFLKVLMLGSDTKPLGKGVVGPCLSDILYIRIILLFWFCFYDYDYMTMTIGTCVYIYIYGHPPKNYPEHENTVNSGFF